MLSSLMWCGSIFFRFVVLAVPLVVNVAIPISSIGLSCGHKPILLLLLLVVLVGLVVIFVHVARR